MKTPIAPVRTASAQAIQDANDLVREAQVRGEIDWNNYAKDFTSGAAGGVAAGAIGGSFIPIPGLGTVGGAGVGALIGGGVNTMANMAPDVWYALSSPQNKAAWQASDLHKHINETIVPALAEINPGYAKVLSHIATQYQQFIDSYVAKKNVDITQNRFNAAPNMQNQAFQQEFYSHASLDKSSNRRFAQVMPIGYLTPENTSTDNPNYGDSGLQDAALYMGASTLGERALNKGTDQLLSGATKIAPKMAKGFWGPMIAGLLAELTVGAAWNFVSEKMQKTPKTIRVIDDCVKRLEAINSLTIQDPKVVMASSQVYTYLLYIKEQLQAGMEAAEAQKASLAK